MASLQDDAYDTAQICLNGHVITWTAIDTPSAREDHCPECGARTIMNCEHCGTPIRGADRRSYELPRGIRRYCSTCGLPYPWTEQALADANALIDELGLNVLDTEQAKEAVLNLVNNTSVELAGVRFRRILSTAAPAVATAIKDVTIRVLSEAALKQMGMG